MALAVFWSIFKKHIVVTLATIAILLGVAGSIWVGYFWGSVEGKAERAVLAKTIQSYKDSFDAANQAVLAGNAQMAQLEKELEDLNRKRQTDEQHYKDSLAIVRAYLPDRAEREIATYYAARRRRRDDDDPDDTGGH